MACNSLLSSSLCCIDNLEACFDLFHIEKCAWNLARRHQFRQHATGGFAEGRSHHHYGLHINLDRFTIIRIDDLLCLFEFAMGNEIGKHDQLVILQLMAHLMAIKSEKVHIHTSLHF